MPYTPLPVAVMGFFFMAVGLLQIATVANVVPESIMLLVALVMAILAYSTYESRTITEDEFRHFNLMNVSTIIIFLSHIGFAADIAYKFMKGSYLFPMYYAIAVGLVLFALSSFESASKKKLSRYS